MTTSHVAQRRTFHTWQVSQTHNEDLTYLNSLRFNTTSSLFPHKDHFDYIKKVAGSSIVGFGGDYDGVTR